MTGRRIRPLLTLVFVGMGAFAGYVFADQYIAKLDAYFGRVEQEMPKLFWLIPINTNQLSDTEKSLLYTILVVVGALLGFVVERIAFHQARRIRDSFEEMAAPDKVAVVVGLVLGLILTALLQTILKTPLVVNIFAAIALCYMSVIALESLKEQIRFYAPGAFPTVSGTHHGGSRPKLLDTNVIIDGRIADVCKAGFVEGPIQVPKFVLEELQQIADSSDSLKRARGRRGLEILNQMQKEMHLDILDFESAAAAEEVDAMLVLAAREVGGVIITNDYNLNKVAGLQGVDVLNVNELANALKPVVLPGEEMTVTVIKEGKEKEQGIGYLDDGTMIVVEGARRMIGETLETTVTSVLQTVQGKMIFGKVKDNSNQGNNFGERNSRSNSGGRPRRKTR